MGDGSRAGAVLVLALASAAAGLAIVLTLAGRAQPAPTWKLVSEETFEDVSLPVGSWLPDTHPSHQRDDGPFGDRGEFFRQRGTTAPDGYRITERFGGNGWLTVESYTRSRSTAPASLFARVADPEPGRSGNRVLRVASPQHTDGIVIRSTRLLPPAYRICVKVGHASFGNGVAGPGRLNGYVGGETDPWKLFDPIKENGFYWLAILDDLPRPHNNVWIHHHRKVVIDSDNNQEAWSEIWDGRRFVKSGVHPVFMLAHSQEGPAYDLTGKPYIPFAGGTWQPADTIRAVDSYKDRTWYTACIARTSGQYWLSVAGDFQFGGRTSYEGAIVTGRVYHADSSPGGWPEYFMLGDPHTNFYRGEVFYDDLRLEVPNGG